MGSSEATATPAQHVFGPRSIPIYSQVMTHEQRLTTLTCRGAMSMKVRVFLRYFSKELKTCSETIMIIVITLVYRFIGGLYLE